MPTHSRRRPGWPVAAQTPRLTARPSNCIRASFCRGIATRSGRRSEGEALRQYERLEEILRRELDAEPNAESRRLREEISSRRFPRPPRTDPEADLPDTGSTSHNLPLSRDSFVGREREVVELKRALPMTNLLTLTGTGGSGKTRLALEVARELIGSYPDGVWLVELAALSDAALVPQAVAVTLEVRERPDQPLAETLREALRRKRLLLDNCEHLVGAAASLTDTLLSFCPRLKILATSREPLGVPGEITWLVRPLSVPDTGDEPGQLERYGAVRLFVERARQRLPAFTLTPQNAGAVAESCRKLDGIPLAIELATARMGALAVEQVAQRLENSLQVLTGGTRTAAPRQETMRATLRWSYELLDEAERTLFRRLSVFAGGWTLEAAEAVGAGGAWIATTSWTSSRGSWTGRWLWWRRERVRPGTGLGYPGTERPGVRPLSHARHRADVPHPQPQGTHLLSTQQRGRLRAHRLAVH